MPAFIITILGTQVCHQFGNSSSEVGKLLCYFAAGKCYHASSKLSSTPDDQSVVYGKKILPRQSRNLLQERLLSSSLARSV